MKPIIPRLSSYTTLFFFPLLILLRGKTRRLLLLLLGLVILAGCFQKYYRTNTQPGTDEAKIKQLVSSQKYFIIHYKDSVLGLNSVSIADQAISARIAPLLKVHTWELYPDSEKPNQFKASRKYAVLSEVHLYVNSDIGNNVVSPDVKIPLSDIYRVDVYEFDEKKSRSSTIWSIVGIAVTTALTVLLIGAAASEPSPDPAPNTSSSCGCPQVYIAQKGDFKFQNGIFSGAVYKNLERSDYLPLPAATAGSNTFGMRITGHDDEIQYLNSVQLIAVNHQPGSAILADSKGKLFSINDPQQPEEAINQYKQDLKEVLNKPDGNSFEFNTYGVQDDYSKAYLTFNKAGESKKAKLIIRARNSGWSAMLNEEYTLLFGEDYFRYREHQEKTGKKKMESLLLKQGLPIKVYLENGDNWEYTGYYPLAGTEGFRDMIMEIKLPANTGKSVRIKLETVYRFWELDYAAIDFTENEILNPILLNPVTAAHSRNGDQAMMLAATDDQYSELGNNENIDLEFQLPEQVSNNSVSYFLVSGGYYHIQKTYPLKANANRLKKFRQAGEFHRFSVEKYNELEHWRMLVKNY